MSDIRDYYDSVGHCGAFLGLKLKLWPAKVYFSPIASLRYFSDCFVIMFFFNNDFLNAFQTVFTLGSGYFWALLLGSFQTSPNGSD